VGIVLRFHHWLLLGVAVIVTALAFLFLYIQLKASHMADLYRLSEDFIRKDEYEAYDLTDKVRLFFWNGEQISSGKRPPKRKNPPSL